jgi:eukaryotic-like serine/threonine-protein kinase
VSAPHVSERAALGLASPARLRIVRPAMMSGTGAADDDAASSEAGDAQDAREAPPDTAATADPGGPTGDLVGQPWPGLAPDDDTRTAASRAGDAMPPSTSERLPAPLQQRDPDRYEIVAEHGRGGLGRVFRARDKELGRDVAVKELLQRTHRSEVRFFREALITARLEHPGIVPVHEAGRWPDGTPFYAMKLVAGRPLSALIAEATTLEERLALLPHVIAVADAIAYAHDRRIIHRDLKPSNVIVGDFGETVVIDWGLAKDLSGDADDGLEEGPYRTPAAPALTVAGSVLGTPAYMAPEQARGEANESSDIYALGGVLFHLLAGVPPPGITATRSRTSSSASLPPGAPRDLAAIVGRAMASEPAARYASAGALAADLRRFSQREPVMARRYSLVSRGLLAMGRNRIASLVAVTGLAVVSMTLAVAAFRVNAQRADAVDARRIAETEQQRTAHAVADLALRHAELLLTIDPTRALAALADYDGNDPSQADRIRAEAIGRGVAVTERYDHHDAIFSLQATTDGQALIAVGQDQKITRVELGSTTSVRVLAEDVSSGSVAAYLPAVGLVAYATAPRGVSLLDVAGGEVFVLDGAFHAAALAASPSGRRLAGISDEGLVTVWQMENGDTSRRVIDRFSVPDAPYVFRLAFADEDRLVAISQQRVHVLSVDGTTISSPAEARAVVATPSFGVAVPRDGTLYVQPLARTQAPFHIKACDGAVYSVARVGALDAVAYSCRDGRIAIWQLDDRQQQPVRLACDVGDSVIATSEDGRYVAAGGASGTLCIYDRATDTYANFRGHPTSITAVVTPSATFRHFGTADSDGRIRVWPVPDSSHRTIFRAREPVFHALFSPATEHLATDGRDAVVRLWSPRDDSVTTLLGHVGLVYGLKFSPDGQSFVTWGFDHSAHLWSTEGYLLRAMRESQSIVADVDFLDERWLVSAGEDGRLLVWSRDRDAPLVAFTSETPLVALEVMRHGGRSPETIFHDSSGVLRILTAAGETRVVTEAGDGGITLLRASSKGRFVAVGRTDGRIHILDAEYRPAFELQLDAPAREIAFAPDERSVVAVLENGTASLVPLTSGAPAWGPLALRARHASYSPDGNIVAVACDRGAIWFHATQTGRWRFLEATGNVLSGAFSSDAQLFAASSRDGSVLVMKVDGLFD